MNTVINKINGVIDSYNGVVDPIEDNANKCLKCCKLEKTGAVAKHVFMGVIVSAAADKDCSADDLKKEIEFLDEKPFVKFGPRFNKWEGLSDALPAWIVAYFEAPERLEEI